VSPSVALLMRRAGISGLPLRRRAKRVPSQKTVTDLVKRKFNADGPNRLWVTDMTEHPTREGKLCCYVVLDVFSRRAVGWATGTAQRADLAANARGMAIDSRLPSPGTGHSGRPRKPVHLLGLHLQGEERGTAALARHGRRSLRQCGHRVVLGTHASRALERQRWRTRVELANAIFEYIEGFHNRRRPPDCGRHAAWRLRGRGAAPSQPRGVDHDLARQQPWADVPHRSGRS
jgi:putative transposase